MPKFDDYTLEDARKGLAQRQSALYASNKRYYNGDHWQAGLGWSGPMPPSNDSTYNLAMQEIQRSFVSKAAIKEVANREMNGVAGREPRWGLTVRRSLAAGEEPTPDEQARIDTGEAALTEWWDARKVHEDIQKAIITALLGGRGVIRMFVPSDEVNDGVVTTQPDLEHGLDLIWIEEVEPTAATVVTDRGSMRKAGVYLFTENQHTRCELSYVDRVTKLTTFRLLSGDTSAPEQAWALPLHGHLMVHEIEIPQLITEQVRQNQKLLDLALTMLQRNVIQGGFLERTILNAQPPGVIEKDEDGHDVFRPLPFRTGAGTTNMLTGVPIYANKNAETYRASDGEDQPIGYANPSVVYRDPVPTDTFTNTRDAAYRTILEECHQLHCLLAGEAAPSGEARIISMSDFLLELIKLGARVNRFVQGILETVLGLGAYFSNQTEAYAGLRATCECRINPGPMSADQLRLVIEQVREKLLSRETAMSELGRDDVDAELGRIAAEVEILDPVTQVNVARARQALEREAQPQPNQDDEAAAVAERLRGTP